ncbi:MAG: hypothetical protein E7480_04695 [Ruminococcaceae bacterium]|nr:hypothetical protein [Oscillospiraceae bacterium]
MKQWIDRKFLNPIKYITAPFDCSEQIKYKKAGAIWQIFCQLALVFIARILTLVLNGFLFNTAKIENVNLLLEAAIITALYACFIVSNWAFCALTEGEATFIEISLLQAFL